MAVGDGSAHRGLGQAGPHRGHRHHDEQADGDEPGDALRPAEPTHRRHRNPAVADLVDDLDDRVDHDHRDGDPHDAQAGPQQQVDDGVVAQRIAEGVADRTRSPTTFTPPSGLADTEPRRRHADEQVRHTDGDGQERDRRHSEAAGGSLVPLVHGRLPSPRLHTRAWGADQAKRKAIRLHGARSDRTVPRPVTVLPASVIDTDTVTRSSSTVIDVIVPATP